MKTEEEARKCWCPFARTVWQFREGSADSIVVANRAENDLPMAWCIASDCMAWRWDPDQPIGEYNSAHDPKRPERQRGFCGLAGKP